MTCSCLRSKFQSYSNWQTSLLLTRLDSWANSWYHSHKSTLFAQISTRVLEIGPGTGINFQYYPAGTEVLAVEPNPYLHSRLKAQAIQYHLRLNILSNFAESLPLPAGSIDHVVGTLVLCSVTSPTQVLNEITRVLSPGGRYYFIEHVAGTGFTKAFQQFLRWPWQFTFSGCQLTRQTGLTISQQHDLKSELQSFQIGPRWLPIRPHIVGHAEKIGGDL